jgi:uncharacterized membrane protein
MENKWVFGKLRIEIPSIFPIKSMSSHKTSALKSIIWRIMGVIVLASVTYFFTRKWITTTYITLVHHVTFLLVFYLHERLWFWLDFEYWKKTSRLVPIRQILKAFTYEIVLGMGLGGLIVYLFTGQWSKVGQITLTYTAIKLVMYYFNEKIWK